jgi:hypothetical protein
VARLSVLHTTGQTALSTTLTSTLTNSCETAAALQRMRMTDIENVARLVPSAPAGRRLAGLLRAWAQEMDATATARAAAVAEAEAAAGARAAARAAGGGGRHLVTFAENGGADGPAFSNGQRVPAFAGGNRGKPFTWRTGSGASGGGNGGSSGDFTPEDDSDAAGAGRGYYAAGAGGCADSPASVDGTGNMPVVPASPVADGSAWGAGQQNNRVGGAANTTAAAGRLPTIHSGQHVSTGRSFPLQVSASAWLNSGPSVPQLSHERLPASGPLSDGELLTGLQREQRDREEDEEQLRQGVSRFGKLEMVVPLRPIRTRREPVSSSAQLILAPGPESAATSDSGAAGQTQNAAGQTQHAMGQTQHAAGQTQHAAGQTAAARTLSLAEALEQGALNYAPVWPRGPTSTSSLPLPRTVSDTESASAAASRGPQRPPAAAEAAAPATVEADAQFVPMVDWHQPPPRPGSTRSAGGAAAGPPAAGRRLFVGGSAPVSPLGSRRPSRRVSLDGDPSRPPSRVASVVQMFEALATPTAQHESYAAWWQQHHQGAAQLGGPGRRGPTSTASMPLPRVRGGGGGMASAPQSDSESEWGGYGGRGARATAAAGMLLGVAPPPAPDASARRALGRLPSERGSVNASAHEDTSLATPTSAEADTPMSYSAYEESDMEAYDPRGGPSAPWRRRSDTGAGSGTGPGGRRMSDANLFIVSEPEGESSSMHASSMHASSLRGYVMHGKPAAAVPASASAATAGSGAESGGAAGMETFADVWKRIGRSNVWRQDQPEEEGDPSGAVGGGGGEGRLSGEFPGDVIIAPIARPRGAAGGRGGPYGGAGAGPSGQGGPVYYPAGHSGGSSGSFSGGSSAQQQRLQPWGRVGPPRAVFPIPEVPSGQTTTDALTITLEPGGAFSGPAAAADGSQAHQQDSFSLHGGSAHHHTGELSAPTARMFDSGGNMAAGFQVQPVPPQQHAPLGRAASSGGSSSNLGPGAAAGGAPPRRRRPSADRARGGGAAAIPPGLAAPTTAQMFAEAHPDAARRMAAAVDAFEAGLLRVWVVPFSALNPDGCPPQFYALAVSARQLEDGGLISSSLAAAGGLDVFVALEEPRQNGLVKSERRRGLAGVGGARGYVMVDMNEASLKRVAEAVAHEAFEATARAAAHVRDGFGCFDAWCLFVSGCSLLAPQLECVPHHQPPPRNQPNLHQPPPTVPGGLEPLAPGRRNRRGLPWILQAPRPHNLGALDPLARGPRQHGAAHAAVAGRRRGAADGGRGGRAAVCCDVGHAAAGRRRRLLWGRRSVGRHHPQGRRRRGRRVGRRYSQIRILWWW